MIQKIVVRSNSRSFLCHCLNLCPSLQVFIILITEGDLTPAPRSPPSDVRAAPAAEEGRPPGGDSSSRNKVGMGETVSYARDI